MNVIKLFFSMLLIGSTLSFAQLNSGYDGPKPEVYSGSKSFVFMYTPFQSNFNPIYVASATGNSTGGTSFSDMNLFGAGFQYYVTKEIALVLGVSFGTSSETQDSMSTSVPKNETSSTSIGVALDANYHLKALYGVSPYVGVNVNFGSYSETDEGTNFKTESKGSGLGAGLNFGFDWYFTEGMSIGGKYTVGFRSMSAPEVTSTSGSTTTTFTGPSRTSIGIGTASVFLNVHL
jgi:long-subunit fatty acid transport protein